MNRTFSDEELRAALIGYYDAAADAAEPKPGQKFNYSPEHLVEMERLIRRKGRRGRRLLGLQRAAAVFIAFILSASAWLAVDAHAREGLFSWVRTVYEDRVEYRFRGGLSAESDELPVYELGWIPEGFELASEESGLTSRSEIYSNSDGGGFIFTYESNIGAYDFSEYYSTNDVIINGMRGEYFNGDEIGESNAVIWINEEMKLLFQISGSTDEDTLIKIAQNIFKK